ncbi:cysteine desulfurase OS=Streptomyces fumanus OX=67302 GN=csd PE=3 SV=1 [Streptomyces fumanus]
MPLDVQALQADFVAFTGHKIAARPASACCAGRQELLEDLPPFLGGGEMIETVSMLSSTYAPAPHKFEAGTPPIAQAVGLGAAIDYLNSIGMVKILAHEHALTEYAVRKLLEVPDLRIIGPTTAEDRARRSPSRSAITRTTWAWTSTNRASRSGSPPLRPPRRLRYGIPATTRASFSASTPAEIDPQVDGLDTYGTSRTTD